MLAAVQGVFARSIWMTISPRLVDKVMVLVPVAGTASGGVSGASIPTAGNAGVTGSVDRCQAQDAVVGTAVDGAGGAGLVAAPPGTVGAAPWVIQPESRSTAPIAPSRRGLIRATPYASHRPPAIPVGGAWSG